MIIFNSYFLEKSTNFLNFLIQKQLHKNVRSQQKVFSAENEYENVLTPKGHWVKKPEESDEFYL